MIGSHRLLSLLFFCAVILHCDASHVDPNENEATVNSDPYRKAMELEARKAVVNSEGMTNEQVAKASVDETSDGEKHFHDEYEPEPDHDSYEGVLQELYEEQSNHGDHELTAQQVEQLEQVAETQQNSEVVEVIDTMAELDEPEGPTVERRKRQLIEDKGRLWEKGILPYSFEAGPGYRSEPPHGQANIRVAMKTYEDLTCVKFPRYTPTVHREMNLSHTYFLKFIENGRCHSFLGDAKVNGGQDIACCGKISVSLCMHELGHALGMTHEQDRPDRDRYVELHPENVEPAYKHVLSKPPGRGIELFHQYDLGSKMQYGSNFFTWNGLDTISILDPDNEFLLGGRYSIISHYDRMAITQGYNCIESKTDHTTCSNSGPELG